MKCFLNTGRHCLCVTLQDFFSEPSQASLTCSISPDATISNPANMGGLEGKEVRGGICYSDHVQ